MLKDKNTGEVWEGVIGNLPLNERYELVDSYYLRDQFEKSGADRIEVKYYNEGKNILVERRNKVAENVFKLTPEPYYLSKYSTEIYHSEDFAWGYGGSGPAQLAYAILRDYTGDIKVSELLYQLFKWEVISKIKGDSFLLTDKDIDAFLEKHQKEIDKYLGGKSEIQI